MKFKNPFRVVYGTELIDKYFSANPDKNDGEDLSDGIFCIENSTHSFERFDKDKIRIFFKNITKYRDYHMYENGVKVGIARLVEPHTFETRMGTIVCSGVGKVTQGKVVRKRRIVDVTISRKLWSKRLTIKIDNDHLNLKIKCEKIYAETYFYERISDLE
ncbi:MAG: hypothetical protein IM606_14895 [Cytophagales bacterium]|jgi:hypothetical protein|nr:hypothetical protein [Cytophagales bacterium]MCA6389192.1 hypothetical protein [Cytophagales bacterium]MCA6390341.1 hypothetical protein [Cytophagales bacterium]MCA6396468.1 hypothetical protein [Cytophagales bacterium]MCA6402246.1 hypothetical protein [Cytophagales bacterium]